MKRIRNVEVYDGINSFDKEPDARVDSGPLVMLCEVVKDYQGGSSIVRALNGVDLRVQAGEFIVVTGKSGAGKTTLINLITGLDRPSSGEIWLAGAPLHRISLEKASRWRGQKVGVVFQSFELLPSLTLEQNVMLAMDFAGTLSKRQQRERSRSLLDQMELLEHASKYPSEISGGQQQRVAIARAIANDPPLIVADEPTGSLDSQTAAAVIGVFRELVEMGKTVILVTHDVDIASQATRCFRLVDGELYKENHDDYRRETILVDGALA